MDILLDIDSTVYPLLTAMNSRVGGERISYNDVPTWDALIERSGGVDQMIELFNQAMSRDVMGQFAPFDGCVEGLRNIVKAGGRLHVVTDRPAWCAPIVAEYLESHGVEIASICCSLGIDKRAIANNIGIDLVIDDHPHLMEALSHEAIIVTALAMQYNVDIAEETGAEVFASWDELGAYVVDIVERASGVLAAP